MEWAWIIGGAIVVVLLLWNIESWRRDFIRNEAETAGDAVDEKLRPIRAGCDPLDAAEIVRQAAVALPRWSFVGRAGDGDATVLSFERKTLVFRFTDDITIRVEPAPGGCTIGARSASRIGTGDLGRNPRNIKELFRTVRSVLEAGPQETTPYDPPV